MRERLRELEEKFKDVEAKLQDPEIISQPYQLKVLGKLHSELAEIVGKFRSWEKAKQDIQFARELLRDSDDLEMSQMAEEEVATKEQHAQTLESELRELLIPKDPYDTRDVIVEIVAGEGGDESALFVGDLLRMYQRFAERKAWQFEMLSSNSSDMGGYKELSFAVKGKGAWSQLKHEAGVHRVQRVPETESQGRVHTSAAGVLVFPEADEVEVNIEAKDIRIDVFRAGGPGGQSVNTTDSAVRITHIPTGTTVQCQDEKSQLQNREKAMRILRARLLKVEQERQAEEMAGMRRGQIRTVDRSEKIRTYNYPQNRVTDHRVGVSSHNLRGVIEGDLDIFVQALASKERAEQLSGNASH